MVVLLPACGLGKHLAFIIVALHCINLSAAAAFAAAAADDTAETYYTTADNKRERERERLQCFCQMTLVSSNEHMNIR